MQIWQAIVLGAIQGLTEFLPVSSSGHLILIQHWFGLKEDALFFSIVLHFGTLVPVVIVLWKEILGLFKKPYKKLLNLIIATIPAGVIGLIFSIIFDLDQLFSNNVWLLGVSFLLTAVELLFCQLFAKKKGSKGKINAKSSLIMGLGQAVGVLPGVSRSGSTVTAGTIAKVKSEENASFTFLMSIPIILAALLIQVVKGFAEEGFERVTLAPLLFGVITAIVTGYIAISFMLKVIKKANYKWFSLYLVFISIATFITAVK